MNTRPTDPRPEVDTLLQATLADDMPREVEGRLNQQVERFLADRRRRVGGRRLVVPEVAAALRRWRVPWPDGRLLRAAASFGLLALGALLHLAGGPRLFASSLARVHESAAIWRAIGGAASMQCGAAARDDLGSPASFAARVYRRWVIVSSERDRRGGDILVTFESRDEGARYDLVVDRRSMLPRRIVKTTAGAAASGGPTGGYDAACTWEPRT